MTARPAFELAEVFRRHSEAYGRANAGHLGRIERRVIGAVAACRTAALGGHVEQCDDCGAVRIAYNSCLMGKVRNGELIGVDVGFGGFRGFVVPITSGL